MKTKLLETSGIFSIRFFSALLVLTFVTPRAYAQSLVREEILGFDATRSTVGYVERSITSVPGFFAVTVVDLSSDGSMQRTRMTTDADIEQARSSRESRGAIELRVARDIASARARFQAGNVLAVSPQNPTSGCSRSPFPTTRFTVGDEFTASITVAASDSTSTLALESNGQAGRATEVSPVTVTSQSTTVRVPYDVIADAREFNGSRSIAMLLRSDACTPEGSPVSVRAVFVAVPPPPERALDALPNGELTEATVIRAIAPRARRRTVDEISGYYDRNARIVFDTSWRLPSHIGDRFLVQYTRIEADMPPPVVDAGEANARFAIVTQDDSGRIRVLSEIVPPLNENVFEGVGQEAFGADLNGDGRPELLVRVRSRQGGETLTLLGWSDGDAVQFLWHGSTTATVRNERDNSAETRHCTVGTDAQSLVLRCALDRNGTPSGRLIQRVRWNAGAILVREERR